MVCLQLFGIFFRCDAFQLAEEALLAFVAAGNGVDCAADLLGDGQFRNPVGREVPGTKVSKFIKTDNSSRYEDSHRRGRPQQPRQTARRCV